MDLIDYIYDECHRQHVTNYGDFAAALHFAHHGTPGSLNKNALAAMVQVIASAVDPHVNTFRMEPDRYGNLRSSHVGFDHGGSAAPVGEVVERFDRWVDHLADTPLWTITGAIHSDNATEKVYVIDMLIKTLLDIHPWTDGNGRTASILRNWMLGTLDNPTPLPYYYGEAPSQEEVAQ